MTDSLDIGGGGGNAFSFGAIGAQPGAAIEGTILDMKEVQETYYDGVDKGKGKTFPSGDPIMEYRVTLQTDLRDPGNPNDDGQRDVYLNGRKSANENGTKSKLCAALDAIRAATGGTSLQRGGFLRLQWVSGFGVSGDPRAYVATYRAPALDLGGVAPAASTTQVAAAQAPPPGWASPAQVVSTASGVPVVHEVAVPPPAAQAGPVYVNRQTGEIASPETVAAVVAAGMAPEVVFAVAGA